MVLIVDNANVTKHMDRRNRTATNGDKNTEK